MSDCRYMTLVDRPASAPEGFEYTGEFRKAGRGEFYLSNDCYPKEQRPLKVLRGPDYVTRHILRQVKFVTVTERVERTITVLGQEVTEQQAKQLLRELEEIV